MSDPRGASHRGLSVLGRFLAFFRWAGKQVRRAAASRPPTQGERRGKAGSGLRAPRPPPASRRSQVCVCPETRAAGGAAARGEALSDRHRCGARRGREELRGSPRESRPRRDGRYEGALCVRKGGRRGTAAAGAAGRWAGPGRAPGRGRSGSTLAPRAVAGVPPRGAEAPGPRAFLSAAARLPSLLSLWRSSAGPRRSRGRDTCPERAVLSGEGPMEPDGAVRRGPRAPRPLWGEGGRRGRELRAPSSAARWGGPELRGASPPQRPSLAVMVGRHFVCGAARRAEADGAGKPGLRAAPLRRGGQPLSAGSGPRPFSSAEGLGLCAICPLPLWYGAECCAKIRPPWVFKRS